MPDIKPRIYAVATAHLDTSWAWDFETTVRNYIPITLYDNFNYFNEYKKYVFSFEGSYRYELMEEYYPEAFKRLKESIKDERWFVAGSAYENGDVNVPSPEALFRNILYGNDYFYKNFGKRSVDIYLPDCFGFGYALPSVAAHANLKGFTTQKLGWSSAYGIPFDLGVWKGPDGASIYASLDARDYNQSLKKDPRKNGVVMRKLKSNMRKYDLPFTYVLHGIGDRGGAPRKPSVETVCKAEKKNESKKVDVLLTSTDRVFRDMDTMLTAQQKAKLPVWDNELVMTDHGVGSYTSRAVGKRWNRRGEMLADGAEKLSILAGLTGAREYPQAMLETCWKRIIAHQFHDDITGTSLNVCYKRNWNDYILSLNQLTEELRASAGALSAQMDSSFVKGRAVAVYNPCCYESRRSVSATLKNFGGRFARVFDSNGNELPAQIESCESGSAEIVFSAVLPPVSMSIFDVRESGEKCAVSTAVKAGEKKIENEKYAVTLDDNGDISSVFDKTASRELLSKPVRMAEFAYNGSLVWPAWEMCYEEAKRAPREYAREPEFEIVSNGAAKAAIKTTRKAGKSSFVQIISLADGGESVDIYNEIEWLDLCTMLKTEFPLAVSNPKARFDLGLGYIERGNMRKNLYEVPAQMWADITDKSGDFGVSVFSDSKYGWDKPNDSTLRLTGIHSPRSPWRSGQHMLEFGLNRYSFALYSHSGKGTEGVQKSANEFNAPASAFETDIHTGALGAVVSLCNISNPAVLVRAIKKAQNSSDIIVRVNEGTGAAAKGVRLEIGAGVTAARDLWASEEEREGKKLSVENGALVFDMEPFEIRTFALSIKGNALASLPESVNIPLEFNLTGVTSDENCAAGELEGALSVPVRQYPAVIESGGVKFATGRGEKSMMKCLGQSVDIPEGAKKLYIVAASFGGDKEAEFKIDGEIAAAKISDACERVGAWDLYDEGEGGYIKNDTLAWNATHAHCPTGDVFAKQLYFFKYGFDVSGKKVFTFPEDESIIVLSAAATKGEYECKLLTRQYDSLERRKCTYKISPEELANAESKKSKKKHEIKFGMGFLKRNFKKELHQLGK